MKVFVSWSGPRSRVVAEALRRWLPDVVNAVEPFVSEQDIEKGDVSSQVIADQLRDSSFGIICLTRENQERPWINYEAGALSKVVGDSKAKVATLLIDIDDPSDVIGPLRAFQWTRLRAVPDMKLLIAAIAKAAGDTRSREQLDRVVDRLWDGFANDVAAEHLQLSENDEPARSQSAMFEELLMLMRQIASDFSHISPFFDAVVSDEPEAIAVAVRLDLDDLVRETVKQYGFRGIHVFGAGGSRQQRWEVATIRKVPDTVRRQLRSDAGKRGISVGFSQVGPKENFGG
jgi:hypothetical protein